MSTVILHHGTGAQDFALEGPPISQQDKSEVIVNARRILMARDRAEALDLLQRVPFDIYPATNHFNDEFHVLYSEVPFFEYEALRKEQTALSSAASHLADALMEAGAPYIRFVAVGFEKLNTADWEVFLCHASEDKEEIAGPLFQHLEQAGIRCWYDEVEIGWGQSIVQKIQTGLAGSRYILVIVSQHLAGKRWARKELDSALHMETSGANTVVLPLIAGAPGLLLRELPFLAEKKYLVWKGDATVVLQELLRLQRMRRVEDKGRSAISESAPTRSIDKATEDLLCEENHTRSQLNMSWQQLQAWREHSPEQRDQIEMFEDEVRRHEQRLAEIRRQLREIGYSALT